jgi:hypothetical protein
MFDTTAAEAPVTRVELLRAVDSAFEGGRTSRERLIATARSTGGRAPVLDTLRSLPDAGVSNSRELWTHLPDMPVR